MPTRGVSAESERVALLGEFARLRRGAGLEAVRLRGRIGPRICRLCGIRPDAADREIRRRIRTVVREICAEFPEHDRLALSYALALEPGTALPQLTDRIDLLAQRIHCGDRTARRRVVQAFERLVDEAAARAAQIVEAEEDPDKGWYVRRFEALLRLDTASPELIERRTIVARRDGLRRIAARFSLPRPADGEVPDATLLADVQQGATIESRERLGEAHFRYVLRLPAPLRQGEEHAYTMVFRVPQEQPLRPHYAYVPLIACDSFHLRVRFDPRCPPGAVWRLYRLAPRLLADRPVPGQRLDLDEAGEVALEFDRPETGFGYGIAWLPQHEAPAQRLRSA